MKLLIRNLSRETTEAELKKLFQEFGTVQKCNLVMDQATGTSKGFGFVEMQKPGPAKAAVKTLNDKVVNGQKIRVKKAETQKETSLQIEPPLAANQAEKHLLPKVWPNVLSS